MTKKRQSYTESQKAMAKVMYEADSMSHSQICKELGIKNERTVNRWCLMGKWVKGSKKSVVENIAMTARMEKAKIIGITDIDQMKKAKELMNATVKRIEKVKVTDKETGKQKTIEVCTDVPDYRTQNEGLKRAMELTGTKIERQEVENKGTVQHVHTYELPKKENPV